MIDHDVAYRVAADRVIAIGCIECSPPKPHMPNDHVVSFQFDRVAGDTYSITWRRVASNRDVGRANAYAVLQADDASHIKENDARAALFAGIAKAAWSVVVQVGNQDNATVASAKTVHAAAFRTGKSRDFCLGQVAWLLGRRKIGFASSRPLLDDWHRRRKALVGKLVSGILSGFGLCKLPLGNLGIALPAHGSGHGNQAR